MVARVMMSETRSVRACRASAVNLCTSIVSAPLRVNCPLQASLPSGESYACELKMYPPAPFATAMPKFTYNPTLVILTQGSLLFALVRKVVS